MLGAGEFMVPASARQAERLGRLGFESLLDETLRISVATKMTVFAEQVMARLPRDLEDPLYTSARRLKNALLFVGHERANGVLMSGALRPHLPVFRGFAHMLGSVGRIPEVWRPSIATEMNAAWRDLYRARYTFEAGGKTFLEDQFLEWSRLDRTAMRIAERVVAHPRLAIVAGAALCLVGWACAANFRKE